MTRLTKAAFTAIHARYEKFVGPDAEQMGFEEYSELYDQFVGEDLPRLMEHVKALGSENDKLRGVISSSRLRAQHGGR